MDKVKLKIRFAGLCVLVQYSDRNAQVLLLDATAVGGPKHSASLIIPDHLGLAGEPDYSLHMGDHEYGVWKLLGDVKFDTGSGCINSLCADTIADLGYIASTRALREPTFRPVVATLHLPAGEVHPCGKDGLFNFKYPNPENPKEDLYVYEQPRLLYDQLEWTGWVDPKVTVSIDRGAAGRSMVAIAPQEMQERPLGVSNVTSGASGARSHFHTYYALVNRPPRMPAIVREGVKSDVPHNPDECRCMFVDASGAPSE